MNEKCPFLSKTLVNAHAHNPYEVIIKYKCLNGKPMILCNSRCLHFNNKLSRNDAEGEDN